MTENRGQNSERPENEVALLSWLTDFFRQFQLAWRLLLDGRIPLIAKLVPLVTVFYFLLPIDIVPDVALGLGQLDDLAIFLVGLRLFINICPPDIVEDHRRALRGEDDVWRPTEGPVIDVEAKIPFEDQENAVEATD